MFSFGPFFLLTGSLVLGLVSSIILVPLPDYLTLTQLLIAFSFLSAAVLVVGPLSLEGVFYRVLGMNRSGYLNVANIIYAISRLISAFAIVGLKAVSITDAFWVSLSFFGFALVLIGATRKFLEPHEYYKLMKS